MRLYYIRVSVILISLVGVFWLSSGYIRLPAALKFTQRITGIRADDRTEIEPTKKLLVKEAITAINNIPQKQAEQQPKSQLTAEKIIIPLPKTAQNGVVNEAVISKINSPQKPAEEQLLAKLSTAKIANPSQGEIVNELTATSKLNNLQRPVEGQLVAKLNTAKIANPSQGEIVNELAATSKLNNLQRPVEGQLVAKLNTEKITNPSQKEGLNRIIEKSIYSETFDNTDKRLAIEQATNPSPLSAVCTEEVFLIITVISLPEYAGRRNLIRQLWANYSRDISLLKNPKPFPFGKKYILKNVVKTVFIISKSRNKAVMNSVMEEARLKKDIVIGGTLEHYRNLTLKTKLALKWSANCKTKFFLKTDDDSFVNPVLLVEWLKVKPQRGLYTGLCSLGAGPIRDKGSKW